MTLDEFVVDFYENAELSKDPEGLLEDAITVDILEYIKDYAILKEEVIRLTQ
jgi:hypothetical protein